MKITDLLEVIMCLLLTSPQGIKHVSVLFLWFDAIVVLKWKDAYRNAIIYKYCIMDV